MLEHSPGLYRYTPLHRARHGFEYVLPSIPHTGSRIRGHGQIQGHSPSHLTGMNTHPAEHEFGYVLPSNPHTGSYMYGHAQFPGTPNDEYPITNDEIKSKMKYF